jgi:hypothetical protein
MKKLIKLILGLGIPATALIIAVRRTNAGSEIIKPEPEPEPEPEPIAEFEVGDIITNGNPDSNEYMMMISDFSPNPAELGGAYSLVYLYGIYEGGTTVWYGVEMTGFTKKS